MDISLNSRPSVSGAKSLLPHPWTNKHRRSPLFVSVQCRATKLSSESETANLYKVLSVSPDNVSAAEIKKAYRVMALKYHPDTCHPSKNEEATRMFVRLHAAYKTLSDRVLRQEYDFGQSYRKNIGDEQIRWQDQILELRRRSIHRMAQKEGTWGSRLRAQNVRES